MVYVISDIHGCDEKFFELLKLIDFKDSDFLYILGDVVDRGTGGLKILLYIKDKANIECLMGNHEMLMHNAVKYGFIFNYNTFLWLCNGGTPTLKEYFRLDREKRKSIRKQIKNLELYKEIKVDNKNFILVHAGVNVEKYEKKKLNKESILGKQKKKDFIWIRKDFYENKAFGDESTVVFGHTPTFMINEKTNPMSIWKDEVYKDKIGIDCGAVDVKNGGRLACLRLNDFKEYYI